ncbi:MULTISPECIES: helix-turn-helix domain-containing protein [Streptomyces]|uniref:helix-turn-helix domain-containing protein n=1 Tax=Streptomyces TaxID=1883 RepID=UPI001912C619|nr:MULTISPECIES: helix-turn-helix transcriptional regulator [Streptomyces]MBK6015909.1 helix-turn-helix transcriptional regulator [Streptomyces sp. MBT53]
MATAQTPPPILRRRLGGLLRHYRRESGLNLSQAANILGWENTRMSRIETGQYQIKADEVSTLLTSYGVTEAGTIKEVTRVIDSGLRAWWAAYADVLPQTYADSIALESEAVLIRAYFPQLIPALLQTPAYAHAIISSSPRAATQRTATALVQVRQARKEILTRPSGPTELRTVLDESALYPRAGSASDLMRDQLLSLLDMSERGNITLRVMPLDAPVHSGLTSNMTIMDFRHPWPALVTVDHTRGGVFLEAPEDVTAFTEVFDAVYEAALSTEESRTVIKKYMKGTPHA